LIESVGNTLLLINIRFSARSGFGSTLGL